MCLYCSFTDIRLMVSYPRMMLKEKAADWTKRAERPLKNMRKCSSLQSSVAALVNESNRCTWRRARMMSSGFVIIVVVKPPTLPAIHCISKCDTSAGSTLINSSGRTKKLMQLTESVKCTRMQTLIKVIKSPPERRVGNVSQETRRVAAIITVQSVASEYLACDLNS